MPKRELIAIDIDDVLANENEAMRLFINETYGLSLTQQDYSVDGEYWGYWEGVWGVGKEEGANRFTAFLESSYKGNEAVIDGAIAVINYLQQNYDLAIVTSRDDKFAPLTEQWLERHFPEVFSRIEFVTAWGKDKKTAKGIICREIGANYLIDDNVDHCRLATEAGVRALLFGDYGWNRGGQLAGEVVRVHDWRAVKEYFDAKIKK